MTLHVISTNTVSNSDGVLLGATDDIVVATGVTLVGSGGDGVRFDTSTLGHYARISGTVIGADDAIELANTCANVTISVDTAGTLSGVFGIYALGDDNFTLMNAGTIAAVQFAVYVTGDNADIVNLGTITSALETAITLGSHTNTLGTEAHLRNYGTISGGTYSVSGATYLGDIVQNFGTLNGAVALLGGNDSLLNRGLINGNTDMGIGNDTLNNRDGEIIGTVHMGDGDDIFLAKGGVVDGALFLDAGDDRYDGRGGEVTGTIFAGLGNDTVVGNSAVADVVDAGDGVDVLDFRAGPAVTVALDQSFDNDGAALGDSYYNFETILGSTKADVLRGSILANQLSGGAGNDDLDGAAGNDTLYGQNGNDSLTGGAGVDSLFGGSGNDMLIFDELSDIGDYVADFSNLAGNNDRFWIDASEFGGGLTAGNLAATDFRVRADNLAQDASDRFIFRTTDATLWFDADGNGTGVAVMVADLQAGATMTAADILLI